MVQPWRARRGFITIDSISIPCFEEPAIGCLHESCFFMVPAMRSHKRRDAAKSLFSACTFFTSHSPSTSNFRSIFEINVLVLHLANRKRLDMPIHKSRITTPAMARAKTRITGRRTKAGKTRSWHYTIGCRRIINTTDCEISAALTTGISLTSIRHQNCFTRTLHL